MPLHLLSALHRAIVAPSSRTVPPATETHHTVLIVGGGAAGITVASQIKSKAPGVDVAIVEPSKSHYYQPAWTLVGGGLYEVKDTRRDMSSVMPKNTSWLQDRVAAFQPAHNKVVLGSGAKLKYDYLIVAAGIQTDWSAIDGLKETLGKNGVASIYSHETAPQVWKNIQDTEKGVALFTQPKSGIKCGGAPQKIMWLAEDWWERQGIRKAMKIEFNTGLAGMFGVKKYSDALNKMRIERNVDAAFQHDLVAVDGPNHLATFQRPDGTTVKKHFDFLHVTPKMKAPDFVSSSTLADPASGFVAVDKKTLQHTTFSNVFAIGDVTNLPTSKTAAAITSQAPVLVHNLLNTMNGKTLTAEYDGYTSCPITTRRDKLMLAEFVYGAVPKESFASIMDQGSESTLLFYLKAKVFPWAYWNLMLQGQWYGPNTVFAPKFA